MRVSILLLSVLVIFAVLACAEAKKKKVAGPCKVKDCKKCNLTGKKCKVCNTGFKPKKKGKKCGPKPCFVNPCKNGGTCSYNKKKKEEKCTCIDGYTGDKCQTAPPAVLPPVLPTDPCSPNPCKNGGSCSAGSCTCAKGFSGDNCEEATGPVPIFALAGETKVSRCNKVGTVVLDKTYRVTYQIKVNTYMGVNVGYVFHIARPDAPVPGPPNDWQAGMAIFGSSYRYNPASDTAGGFWQMCMPFSGQHYGCYNNFARRYSAGEWHTVVTEQVFEGGENINRITVDGELHNPAQTRVVNSNQMAFGKVDVFVSDCWQVPFENAEIRNLEIISPVE